jgi:hypothetical protein
MELKGKNIFMRSLMLLMAMCGMYFSGIAQERDGKNIRAIRIGYITNKLSLTPEESEKFWPIYNHYEAELKKTRLKYKVDQDLNSLNDQEVERSILDGFEMEEQVVKLKRELFHKLKGVIPVRKIFLLSRAEREFNRELINRLQQGKN